MSETQGLQNTLLMTLRSALPIGFNSQLTVIASIWTRLKMPSVAKWITQCW